MASLLGWSVEARGQAWPEGYSLRAVVTAEAPRLPGSPAGDEVAWVEIPTYGLDLSGAMGSASDSFVRVVARNGAVQKSRVLGVGPGSRLRVAFTLGTDKTYRVYVGGAARALPGAQKDAAAVAERFGVQADWPLRRGLLLESWAYRGGPMDTLEQTVSSFARAAREPMQGSGFVATAFLGHNPFGPPQSYCHRYTGWLSIRDEGEYLFALSSDDASHVFLDDALLIEWPGLHGMVGDQRFTVRRRLRRGVYKLSILHIEAGGGGGLALVWQPPGQKQVQPIPASAFLPVVRGEVTEIGLRDARGTAWFDWQWRGEAAWAERYSQRLRFEARLGRAEQSRPLRWELAGHGTRLTGETAIWEAVVLHPGAYEVRLTVGDLPPLVATVVVDRNWNLVTAEDSRLDRLEAHALAVKQTLAERGSEELWRAVLLFEAHRDRVSAREAGRLLLSGREDALHGGMLPGVEAFIQASVAGGQSAAAVEALLAGVGRASGDAAFAAELRLRAGRLALDQLDLVDVAVAQAEAIGSAGGAVRADQRRQGQLLHGDALRRRGRAEEAAGWYERAGATLRDARRVPLMRSSYQRSVEDYTRRGELEAAEGLLGRWADELPLDRLSARWTLLRLELLAALRRPDAAIREAQTLAMIAPGDVLTPMAMLRQAELLTGLGRREEALEVLREIVRRHPEHEAARTAARLLP